MDLKTSINSIGIILNIVGAGMLYYYSPLNEHTIDGGNFEDDCKKLEEETNKKNKMMKIGVVIAIVGSLMQLASNVIPPNTYLYTY